MESYERQRDKLQNYIDKNRVAAATAKMAQSRIKILAKLEVPDTLTKDPHFAFNIPEPEPLQQPIIQMTDISFGYSLNRVLYSGWVLSQIRKNRSLYQSSFLVKTLFTFHQAFLCKSIWNPEQHLLVIMELENPRF